MQKDKRQKRIRRHSRVRGKVIGTENRPRLSVFRSNKHIWAQLINDLDAKTIVSAGDLELQKGKEKEKTSKGERVGLLIAEKAKEKKITRAVFDRGGYAYHGLVRALAEGARRGGLRF